MKTFIKIATLLGTTIAISILLGCSPRNEKPITQTEETETVEQATRAPKPMSLHEQQIAKIKSRYTDAITTDSGLCYVVDQEGAGEATPSRGDRIQAHYTGAFWDGEVFDSSVERGDPLAFSVGIGKVIEGWDEAFLTMKKGEKRTLIIPSELGYGPHGYPGAIPANAILIFEVELVDF